MAAQPAPHVSALGLAGGSVATPGGACVQHAQRYARVRVRRSAGPARSADQGADESSNVPAAAAWFWCRNPPASPPPTCARHPREPAWLRPPGAARASLRGVTRLFGAGTPGYGRSLASVLPLPRAQSVQAARMGPPGAAPAGGAGDDAAWVEAMLAAEGPLTAEQVRAPTARLQRGRAAAAQRRPARAFRASAPRRARGVTRQTRHLPACAALTAAAAGAGGAAAAAQRARGCGGGARGVPAAERAVAPRQERGAGGARASRFRAHRRRV